MEFACVFNHKRGYIYRGYILLFLTNFLLLKSLLFSIPLSNASLFSWSPFTFLQSIVTPDYRLISENLELETMEEIEHGKPHSI